MSDPTICGRVAADSLRLQRVRRAAAHAARHASQWYHRATACSRLDADATRGKGPMRDAGIRYRRRRMRGGARPRPDLFDEKLVL
ncbi:MAG: hypothetical protein AB1761_11605, partial [Pseudomonadota bacterium]